MWTLGAVCMVAGLLVVAFFKDPGIGAAEKQLADLASEDRPKTRVTVGSVIGLFRIPSYAVMMVSRLLSGHLLIAIFGVQFLVTERGIDNSTAIVLPELRGQAYAIWLTVFETIAWAAFSLLAGTLAATLGIQGVFLWLLVVLMLVNGLLLSILYVAYPRDAARVTETLDIRRRQALAD
ncbi:hypothetical protein AB0F17_63040 [Nonomuraea sp. NPDC026600]|uniref:hypothetical protein n=1 Tax=Nonomuraea sp. NPDC026600 TaxID=3155363 RepID=UPI0033FA49DF